MSLRAAPRGCRAERTARLHGAPPDKCALTSPTAQSGRGPRRDVYCRTALPSNSRNGEEAGCHRSRRTEKRGFLSRKSRPRTRSVVARTGFGPKLESVRARCEVGATGMILETTIAGWSAGAVSDCRCWRGFSGQEDEVGGALGRFGLDVWSRRV